MHVYPPPEPWPPAVREFIETSRRECAEPIAYATATNPGSAHPPRQLTESFFNVTRWTEMPRGGHFAALEEPELLLAGGMLMLGEATAAIRGRGREWAPRRR
jgi:hypothetical protein